MCDFCVCAQLIYVYPSDRTIPYHKVIKPAASARCLASKLSVCGMCFRFSSNIFILRIPKQFSFEPPSLAPFDPLSFLISSGHKTTHHMNYTKPISSSGEFRYQNAFGAGQTFLPPLFPCPSDLPPLFSSFLISDGSKGPSVWVELKLKSLQTYSIYLLFYKLINWQHCSIILV